MLRTSLLSPKSLLLGSGTPVTERGLGTQCPETLLPPNGKVWLAPSSLAAQATQKLVGRQDRRGEREAVVRSGRSSRRIEHGLWLLGRGAHRDLKQENEGGITLHKDSSGGGRAGGRKLLRPSREDLRPGPRLHLPARLLRPPRPWRQPCRTSGHLARIGQFHASRLLYTLFSLSGML